MTRMPWLGLCLFKVTWIHVLLERGGPPPHPVFASRPPALQFALPSMSPASRVLLTPPVLI